MMRAFAGICALAIFSAAAFGQSAATPAVSTSAPATPATFEIADVHTSAHTQFPFFQGGVLRRDRYLLKNATMVDLIATAYGVDNDKVVGGPSWLEKDRFDVVAKTPPSTSPDAVKLMLQSLLADRFKLVEHTDTKPMPVFDLTVGKAGKPKLKQADGSGESGCEPQQQNFTPGTISYITVSCHNVTMEAFAQTLRQFAGGYLNNPVVDSTGLKGSWDFDIKWSGRGQLAQAGADGISIFAAVDKQLGLKLDPQKLPMPVIVVDSANEKPTDNPPELAATMPPAPPAEFEVALIKPSPPGATPNGAINGGQINLQAITLKSLITIAWGILPNDDELLAGAPNWLDSDNFDIVAKVSTDALAAPANGPPIDFDDLRSMLRALLIERFKMVVHTEDRPVNIYALVAANPKLRKADPTNRTGCKNGPGPDGKDPRIANPILSRLISCQNITMAEFADQLRTMAGGYFSQYPAIVDATGLDGAYDFTLSFSPAQAAGLAAGDSRGGSTALPPDPTTALDPSGAISVFEALNKQLGLKLEKQKRPVSVLVIDHIEEKPTEN